MFKRKFYTQNLFSKERVGPHNQDVISVLVGNLLCDGYAEKRKNSTRFQIHMISLNAEYIFWLFKFFAEKGYCSPKKPVVKKQIGKKNIIYFSIKWKTFSFSSLNFLYDSFYSKNNLYLFSETNKEKIKRNQNIKNVPTNIYSLLTQQALAIWIMDYGGKSGSGLKISTESFCYQDNLLLQKTLKIKFSIEPSIQRHKNKYSLYFDKNQIFSLYSIVKPYIYPCMRYKFNVEKNS